MFNRFNGFIPVCGMLRLNVLRAFTYFFKISTIISIITLYQLFLIDSIAICPALFTVFDLSFLFWDLAPHPNFLLTVILGVSPGLISILVFERTLILC